ncbi:peptide chain release factor N(5)-glutamine methyltransferase [Sphingomonas sabuli]|uniref:Release factor glutamine methyltransferase n=1 Tax=Sphingomonas sabuli TaxID=2764186 RepID=A0A7G9KZZ1_9SPHN|nr:peptide chain release factor N(5)-glutamine methyltransferase [Sphingomonas sabuli]QNM81940.1 peptide chain release factor N(5)-glutamine methyltransferase [Sphingomonas sabuli]
MKPLTRALDEAARQLTLTSDTARLDAELLMAEALNIDRDKLLLNPPDKDPPKRFWTMVERRAKGEPVAYITGRRAFWDIDIHVGPGVLVPRPDSEVLIASAIAHFEGKADGPGRILDLGTGPGTLLLAALDLWPKATGIGVDSSRRALSYASANARRLGFDDRAKFKLGDWADGIAEGFDLILCNPPYVAEDEELGPGVAEHEPDEALFAGPDGLDCIRRLAPEIPRLLNPGGLAAVEIGAGQAAAARPLLERDGLKSSIAKDFGGRDRAVLLTRA